MNVTLKILQNDMEKKQHWNPLAQHLPPVLWGCWELVSVSRWTGKATAIASLPIGAELSYDGRSINYQNADGEFIVYDTKEKT